MQVSRPAIPIKAAPAIATLQFQLAIINMRMMGAERQKPMHKHQHEAHKQAGQCLEGNQTCKPTHR
eukprot:5735396-Amphidinium_carterae.1